MTVNSTFFTMVYQVVRLIPPGRVTTYGAIASYLGTKLSARMVGWAMNAAHSMKDVPAHRVVNRAGALTGKMHFSDPYEMENLLKAEGIQVIDDYVQALDIIIWLPQKELELN